MTQKQTNSLNMFVSVLQYLNDNSGDWNSNTVISAGIKEFSSTVDAIQKQSTTQQGNNKKGYTVKKDQDLENLVELAYKLALRVKNYAVNINDAVLKQAVDFSRTELEAGKETDIVNRCLNIVDAAGTVMEKAPPEYKITAELAIQVNNAAATIEPDRAERNVISGTHTGATAQIATLITIARNHLKTLDDLIEGDADDDASEFVQNYFIMRRTVDRKAGSKKNNDKKTIDEAASKAE